MTTTKKAHLPIGYWLKRADNLLTEQIAKAQAANNVTRSDWQVLNMLSEMGSVSREQIFETMRTFIDAKTLDEIIARLMERGWIESHNDSENEPPIQLTEEGRRRHKVIHETQTEVRKRSMQGITEDEYATVMRVLQRLVGNLEDKNET